MSLPASCSGAGATTVTCANASKGARSSASRILGPMRILLVEDELEMAAWLQRALAQSGFLPEHAKDAQTADEMLQAAGFDAVVMDHRLPDKHGLVLLRELRARGDTTPVLILTAQDRKSTRLNSSHV